MTCNDRKDLFLLYVAGSLDPAEIAELRFHLATGCPTCAGSLAQAQSTFDQIPLSLPPVPAPSTAWQKLESRIALAEDSPTDRDALSAPFNAPNRKSFAWLGWAAAALIAIAMGINLYQQSSYIYSLRFAKTTLETENNKLINQYNHISVQLPDLQQQLKLLQDELHTQMASYDAALDKLARSDQFAFGGGLQPDIQAKLFWDKSAKTWTVVAGNAKPLSPGKTYELWAILKSGEKIGLVSKNADPSGRLVLQTPLAADPDQIAVAAFTDEPDGGLPQPTGQVQFLASLTKSP